MFELQYSNKVDDEHNLFINIRRATPANSEPNNKKKRQINKEEEEEEAKYAHFASLKLQASQTLGKTVYS